MQMSPPDYPRLGSYVRERRPELGLTQEEIATRGGPSTATLRLIEGGKGPFRAKSLRQLADALHWTPESPRAQECGIKCAHSVSSAHHQILVFVLLV